MNATPEPSPPPQSPPAPAPARPDSPLAAPQAESETGSTVAAELARLPRIALPLRCDAAQEQALLALRGLFTEACNMLAQTVQQTRCWNRVALHHMAYKPLRERFPQLGSQMACNVIYSVCRAARRVYQHPDSPHNMARLQGSELPALRFEGSVPVFFDRHTLSLKKGAVSLFTLDGRMRLHMALPSAVERRFHEEKLRETVLMQRPDGSWVLVFEFVPAGTRPSGDDEEWPQYLLVSRRAATTAAR